MKNLYYFLFLVLVSASVKAQIVTIPDPEFKAKLLEADITNQIAINSLGVYIKIDANSDGEIQENEALEVNSLNLGINNITSIEGIKKFSNMKYFFCESPNLLTIDVSMLTNLLNISVLYSAIPQNLISFNASGCTSLIGINNDQSNVVYANAINISNCTSIENFHCLGNSLDVTGCTNLKNLIIQNSNIQVVDLSNLTNLTSINFVESTLNSINLSGCTSLETVDSYSAILTTLNLSNCTSVKRLSLGYYNTNLYNLNLTGCVSLETIDVSNCKLTTLDLSDCPSLITFKALDAPFTGNLFTTLDFSNCINLETLQLQSSNLISLFIKNGKNENLTSSYIPGVIYICADESQTNSILDYLSMSGGSLNPNVLISSYCSFTPGGNYNTTAGNIKFDYNNNGCDANDFNIPNVKLKMNNQTNTWATFTKPNGDYTFYSLTGDFNITPEIENTYFTISPATAQVNFADANNNFQTQNFCITPNGVHNDIEIIINPTQQGARPGFDATYQLVYKNKGNQTLSGNINLAFDDAVLDFVSANPSLANQTVNNLSWSYANLLPFESRTIDFTLNVNSPQETPAVNIGDVLHFTASIDPISGDETSADNTFTFAQTVQGSYDPNDKICLEGNTITPEKVGDYLHYIIHFQNSGTAAAENIVVKDVIDTTKFDIASLQLTSASHPYETKVTGDKIEFIFENIQLPAEIDNEPASHGFVAFKIKTKSDLVLGNTVSNKADIYFDYNFPIVTESAVTTVSVLGVNEFENKSVSVFPNPVSDVLNITSIGIIKSVQVYDVQGRLTDTFLKDEEKTTINLSNKKTGAYFVKIFTEKGVKVEKVVKK